MSAVECAIPCSKRGKRDVDRGEAAAKSRENRGEVGESTAPGGPPDGPQAHLHEDPRHRQSRQEMHDHPPGSCRYQVAWSINPHMQLGAVDFERAAIQHDALKRALADEGATVLELPFVHGAYDSVFAKDPAFFIEHRGQRRALLASQRFDERRSEQVARARHFERLGYDVVDAPDVPFEGGDVAVLPPGDRILLGHGPRTDRRAAAWLEANTHAAVIPLELRDPHFFHLDVALGVLPDTTVLVCEDAFTPAALHTLRSMPGIRAVIPVAREDALAFGLNLVSIGDAVLCGAEVPRVQRILRARGLRPVVVPLDEFHLAGGSAACLATRVHRDPREIDASERGPRAGISSRGADASADEAPVDSR